MGIVNAALLLADFADWLVQGVMWVFWIAVFGFGVMRVLVVLELLDLLSIFIVEIVGVIVGLVMFDACGCVQLIWLLCLVVVYLRWLGLVLLWLTRCCCLGLISWCCGSG